MVVVLLVCCLLPFAAAFSCSHAADRVEGAYPFVVADTYSALTQSISVMSRLLALALIISATALRHTLAATAESSLKLLAEDDLAEEAPGTVESVVTDAPEEEEDILDLNKLHVSPAGKLPSVVPKQVRSVFGSNSTPAEAHMSNLGPILITLL